MQFLIKFVLSTIVIFPLLGSLVILRWFTILRWIWTHDIDLSGTLHLFREKAVAPPEWIVTKDPGKIYRSGKSVGDASDL